MRRRRHENERACVRNHAFGFFFFLFLRFNFSTVIFFFFLNVVGVWELSGNTGLERSSII